MKESRRELDRNLQCIEAEHQQQMETLRQEMETFCLSMKQEMNQHHKQACHALSSAAVVWATLPDKSLYERSPFYHALTAHELVIGPRCWSHYAATPEVSTEQFCQILNVATNPFTVV